MSVDNFAILAFVDQLGLSPRRVAWRSLRAKGMGVSVGLPVDGVLDGGSEFQAGVEIYYWGHPRILAHFEQPK